MSKVKQYYIGWDVGAWSCNANKKSCDAIVILDADFKLVGKAWLGSLNSIIFKSDVVEDFLKRIFEECDCEDLYTHDMKAVVAIDAVLGFSDSFRELINNRIASGSGLSNHKTNSYLFRKTEIFLSTKGNTPLSTLTHMIGSQAAKAMHVVAKFSQSSNEIGIWKNKLGNVTLIETYPATCRQKYDQQAEDYFGPPENKVKGKKTSKYENDRCDKADAYRCAMVAGVFNTDIDRSQLYQPNSKDTSLLSEGWIWALNF